MSGSLDWMVTYLQGARNHVMMKAEPAQIECSVQEDGEEVISANLRPATTVLGLLRLCVLASCRTTGTRDCGQDGAFKRQTCLVDALSAWHEALHHVQGHLQAHTLSQQACETADHELREVLQHIDTLVIRPLRAARRRSNTAINNWL
jgi:hypothetical protein